MIGLALVLRDLVHRELGIKWAGAPSWRVQPCRAFLAPPALVVASCAASLPSEFAHHAVYAPLYRQRQ
jgi:queuosine precursor transporter